jgi:toxin CptA
MLLPSHRAVHVIFAVHIVCLGLIAFAMEQGTGMLVLLGAVGLSWLYVRRHAALGLSPQSVTRMVWHADGSWTLHRPRGEPVAAELLPGSLVHPWLMVLRFRLKDGTTLARVIAGDELPEPLLRRLRARLNVA